MAKKTFNQNLTADLDVSSGLDASDFWEWYEAHRDHVVLDVGFWFISFDITVEDLQPLFARIFGPRIL